MEGGSEGGGGGGGGGSGMQMLQSPLPAFGVSSSFRQSSPIFRTDSSKRIGVPPSHPNNQQIMASRSGLGSQNLNRGGSTHSRSLSQSAVFSLDNCLPPSNPLPSISSASNQSDLVWNHISMQDKGTTAIPNKVNDSLSLPPRRGHRRSMSDSVPLAFSAMIQSSPQLIPIGSRGERESSNVVEGKSEGEVVDDFSAYMNLDKMDTLNLSRTEDKDLDGRVSSTKTNGGAETSDNEVESRVKEGLKRIASEDIGRSALHCRSVSMDSYTGSLQFDDESMKFPPTGTQGSQQSPRNFNLEFGNADFSEAELKKIMANEKLTEIAMADPKRAKRILANRLSASRSKERKMRYISELEQKVQTLQAEATTLSTQVTVLQRDSAALTCQNNELKFCLQAMEQQAKLKDDLNEALVAEVQHLRLASAELRGNAHRQFPINHQLLKLQLQQPTQQDHQKQLQQHLFNQLQSQQQNNDTASKLK